MDQQCHDHRVLLAIIHLVMQCRVHHNNDQFVPVNNHDLVVAQVVLADNVQVLLHVQVVLADNVQVLHHVQVDKADNVQVVQVKVVKEQVLHIVQVEILAAVHQEDLIVQVAHVQVLAVAVILQVRSVRADQRRVMPRRVRKLCVMISKTCKRLHLAA